MAKKTAGSGLELRELREVLLALALALPRILVSVDMRPPIFRELDDDALYERLAAEVRALELELQRENRQKGRRFMGLRKLGRQAWNQAPKSFEERFTITPKVAAASRWLVVAELQRDREWERQYAAARALLLEGKPAVFPAGTYWLRRFVGVDLAAGAT